MKIKVALIEVFGSKFVWCCCSNIDTNLKGIRTEDNYYSNWFDTSTFNSNDFAVKRLINYWKFIIIL